MARVATPVAALLITAAALVGTVPDAAADDAVADAAETGQTAVDERPVYYGSEVVVVSDRPSRFEEFAAGADSLEGDVKAEIAWLPFVAFGAYGSSVYPAVRGLEAEHVAFEYDGVPLNSVQNGLADLALFDVFDLSATVMRGPFARMAGGRPAQAAVSMRQSDERRSGAALSVGSRRNAARLSLARGATRFRLGMLYDEGYAEDTAEGGFGAELSSQMEWGLGALTYIRMNRDVPGPEDSPGFRGELEDELLIARLGLNPIGLAHPAVYLTRQEENYRDSLSEPTHVVTAAGAIIDGDVGQFVPGAVLTASVDYSKVESSDPLNPDLGGHSRGSGSVVASQIREHGPLSIAIELAATHTSDFGGALSGAVGAAVASAGTRAWLSVGSAYRPPTINQLYWPEDVWTGGNSDLEPERVMTIETGVEGAFDSGMPAGIDRVAGSLTGYASFADDLISWAMADTTGIWRPSNVGRARLRGVELELSVERGDVAFSYAGSFSSAEDADTDVELQYRPGVSQSLGVSVAVEAVHADLRMRYVGSVYADDPAGRVELPSFTVVDLGVMYVLPLQGIAVRLDALNLFDESYQTRLGYDMPGREWRASVLIGWSDDGGSG
ncbi:MAG: TonB-dependent receptor [Candidatus Eisenbacteria bacterium]|nr:TonB-dependent receptor [Candidatus Eisenbacteria bacterium]